MRTIKTKVYKFNELSKEAQEKAINDFRNTNSWLANHCWESIQYDAINVGLKIISLDDHRPNKGEFIESSFDTANKILVNHGETCETYKTAKNFLGDWAKLVAKHSDGINLNKVDEENEFDFDNEANDLEKDFLESILEDYRILYNKDCEYQYSDENIIETITANGYEFTKDGKRF